MPWYFELVIKYTVMTSVVDPSQLPQPFMFLIKTEHHLSFFFCSFSIETWWQDHSSASTNSGNHSTYVHSNFSHNYFSQSIYIHDNSSTQPTTTITSANQPMSTTTSANQPTSVTTSANQPMSMTTSANQPTFMTASASQAVSMTTSRVSFTNGKFLMDTQENLLWETYEI